MGLIGFLWRHTIKRLLHFGTPVGQFVTERRPHLEDAVSEPEFEDRTGDRWIGALVAQINMLPGLGSARFVIHDPQGFWILGGVGHGTLGPNHPNDTAVPFPRRDQF